MARLVSKTVTPDVSVVVNTKHTDGTIDKNVLNIGDVTTLRYIANNQLLSITGRVTAFGIKDSSNSLIKFKKTNSDTFAADAVVQTITLDASEQYSSNLVTINAREIVEAQGVDDVVKVDVVAEMNVTVESTYTDGSVDSDLLKTDYLISDITILSGTPGTPDITGSFKIAAFAYNMVSSVVSVTGLILTNEDGSNPFFAPIGRIISIEDVYGTVEVNEDNFDEVLASAVTGSTLKLTESIERSQAIVIPEGISLILDLNDQEITTSDDSINVIENSGDLTITGGNIIGFAIVNNESGTLTIDDGVEITTTAEAVTGAGALKNYGTLVVNAATITVPFEGSTRDAGGPAGIRNFGTLEVNGATVTSNSKRTYAIITGSGSAVVNDADINGVHGGIALDGGTLVVNDGSFVSAEYYGCYASNDQEAEGVVVINGGTFNGPNYSIWIGSDDNTSVDSAIQIYGGTFEKQLKNQSNVSEGYGIKIYGGNFKVEPVADMIADGFGAVLNSETGYYEVLPVNTDDEVDDVVESDDEPDIIIGDDDVDDEL